MTIFALCWLVIASVSVGANKSGAYTKLSADAAIAQLLEVSAPPVDWRDYLRQHPQKRNVPAANASLDEVLEYWRYAPEEPSPDLETRKRLLEVCERDPDELAYFIRFFAKASPETHDRLKKIYDRVLAQHTTKAAELAEELQKWLMKHTRYFRNEFVARVFPVEDTHRFPRDENELKTFIDLDRESARTHLLEQAKSSDEKFRIYAFSLLFEYFGTEDNETDSWRSQLCETAINTAKPMDLREKAIFGAMKREWPGQQKWFVKLFENRELLHQGKPADMNALARCVALNPDRWIPEVASLVATSNSAVRDNAAQCLIQFEEERIRADALRPLLPWLDNPSWAHDVSGFERSELFKNLKLVELPECIPHLMKIVDRESGVEFEMRSRLWRITRYAMPSLPCAKD